MSIPKDLPKSIGEQTDKTPNLDFLDKVDGPVSTQTETEFPSVTKGDNQVAQGYQSTELEEKEKSLEEQQTETLYAANFFKLPSKKTMTDVPYGKNKEERISKQKEILNKIETDVEVDANTGSIILKEFSQDETKFVDDLLKEFNLGTLDEAKKNTSTKFIFKDLDTKMDGTYDPGAFSDLVFKMFEKKIGKAKGGKVSMETLMSKAAELGRADVYLTMLNKKPGQKIADEVIVRSLIETKLLYTNLRKIAQKGADGTATEGDKVEFYKTLRLYGLMLQNTAAELSGAARTMRSVQEVTKVDPELKD